MAKWVLDTEHTQIGFTARHMMITTVRGHFTEFEGTIEFDPANPGATSVETTIQMGSVSSGVADRDNHLRSADFFNVEEFPTMTFKSTGVAVKGEDVATLTGDLTIRDVTKPVTLEVTYLGESANPFTQVKTVGFEANTTINREDFNLTWNQPLASGGVLVSKEIKIQLDVQAIPVEQPETA